MGGATVPLGGEGPDGVGTIHPNELALNRHSFVHEGHRHRLAATGGERALADELGEEWCKPVGLQVHRVNQHQFLILDNAWTDDHGDEAAVAVASDVDDESSEPHDAAMQQNSINSPITFVMPFRRPTSTPRFPIPLGGQHNLAELAGDGEVLVCRRRFCQGEGAGKGHLYSA